MNGLKSLDFTRTISVVCLLIRTNFLFTITSCPNDPVLTCRGPNGSYIFNCFICLMANIGLALVCFILIQFQHSSLFNTDTYHHAQRYVIRAGFSAVLMVCLWTLFIKSNYFVSLRLSYVTSTLVAMEYVYTLIRLLIDGAKFCCEKEKPCCILHHYHFLLFNMKADDWIINSRSIVATCWHDNCNDHVYSNQSKWNACIRIKWVPDHCRWTLNFEN